MSNLLKDISAITAIPETTLSKLLDRTINCIGYEASNLSAEESVAVDIGIGELRVRKNGDELLYKFIPSTKLDSSVRSAIQGDIKLIQQCEDSLVGRIMSTYKNLI